jgi:hypothetical protein
MESDNTERMFMEYDGGLIFDSDSTIIFRANNTSGAQLKLNNSTGDGVEILAGDLRIGDSQQIEIGDRTGGDMQIYHDGSNNYINATEGHLILEQNENDHDIFLKSDNGSGGTVTYLQLDGSTTDLLLTPPSGKISGSLNSTGSFGIVEVHNTPGGDYFVLGHPANKARLNYDSAVFTFLDADNSYGGIAAESGSFFGDVGIKAAKKLFFDDGEAPVAGGTYISETSDNILEFYTDNNPQLKISNSEGVVINDGSYASFDFRVESNDRTHMLFVDSGNNRVGINTSSPSTDLHINTTDDGSVTFTRDGSHKYSLEHDTSQFYLYNRTLNKNQIEFTHSGPVTINEDGHSTIDFRVEGDSDANLFFTDASADRVGIGTNSPSSILDVNGSVTLTGIVLDGNTITGVDDSGEFTDDDSHIMTSAAVNDRLGSVLFNPDFNNATMDQLGVNVSCNGTDGRIDAGNDIVAFSTSDERLKENIKPLDNALDKVLKISGVGFDWKPLTEEEKKTIHGNEGHDVGVIAQEVEEVLPEVVTTRDSGYKAVKYEKLVPLLIESIKELKKEIEELKK